MIRSRLIRVLCLRAGLAAAAFVPLSGPAVPPARAEGESAAAIVAVVNGDVISRGDVDNRRRLFALSTGLPVSSDVLGRLSGQITRQLIDEKLRLQEAERRRVVVDDKDIARAIKDVEGRNGMQPGTLQKRLSGDGVSFRTLIDQIRVQIGWTRVLRQVLGPQAQVSDADIAEREKQLKAQTGQTEYRVSEIFIPAETPSHAAEAGKFADIVLEQLHAGAPFPVVAAQFSQTQTALQGGDLGWVQASQLDPAQVRVLNEMPVGAVSNPLRVPGGFSVVTLRAKREIGRDVATVLDVRQAFYAFTSKLDPANPTPQQRSALEQAQKLSATAKDCATVEAANKAAGAGRPSNPGDVRLDAAAPALRAVLAKLQPGQASQPLVAEDGILVVMLCGRQEKNLGLPNKQELADTILNERIELASRQLMHELQRKAIIDEHS